MTREEIIERIKVMQAYINGEKVQYKKNSGKWADTEEPIWSNLIKYRIKPEPKFRPFKDAEECWAEMEKHQPFGWVKTKDKGIRLCIIGLNQKSAFTQVGHKYDEALDEFIFADGLPFGVKVEE